MKLCSFIGSYRCFRDTFACSLVFWLEYGETRFLRNVGIFLTSYKDSCPRGQQYHRRRLKRRLPFLDIIENWKYRLGRTQELWECAHGVTAATAFSIPENIEQSTNVTGFMYNGVFIQKRVQLFLLFGNTFPTSNVKNGPLYIRITHCLKMPADIKVGFVNCTEWSPVSPDFNPLCQQPTYSQCIEPEGAVSVHEVTAPGRWSCGLSHHKVNIR